MKNQSDISHLSKKKKGDISHRDNNEDGPSCQNLSDDEEVENIFDMYLTFDL